MSLRRFAVGFLAAEAVGVALWWCLLLAWPESRAPFKATGAPDSTLLAFGAPDAVLFVGVAGASAYGLARRRAWPLLCCHAGAAAYAALYCLGLALITGGDGLLGAALMAPSLVVPGYLAVRLRPKDTPCSAT